MSETPTPGSAVVLQTETQVPERRREYARVDSAMGIMDTARFEHLGRVAQVMARAGLMPQSLTHYKPESARDNDPLVQHPPEVIVARAYLIANQADLWNADPMAVAQCTSLVHGKLMYEGKLVHAIVSAKLGVDLIYEFGRYKLDLRDILVGQMPGGDDQSLGVRVSGTLPGETEPRTVSGSVAMWHKGAKSPWGAVSAWPRQLRYMGAREWARAHKPSLLLGIITEDEIEEYDLGRQVGHIAPAGPQALHAGFEDQRSLPEPDKPARRRRNADKAAEIAPKLAQGEPQAAEDDAPGASEPDGPTPAQEAAQALDGDDLPDALKDDADEGIAAGHAEPGEVYLLDGDEVDEKGRLPTYANGELFSTVGQEGAAKLPVYGEHAPRPTGTAGAQPADPEPDMSGSATDASDGSAEESSGPQASSAAQDDGSQVDDIGPGGDEDDSDLPAEFRAYIAEVEDAKAWAQVKRAMATFYQTKLFKDWDVGQQNKVRANTWDAVLEIKLPDLPDHAVDVSAFRLWIEWIEDADAITGTLAVLEKQPAFSEKEEPFKEAIRRAVASRLETLQG